MKLQHIGQCVAIIPYAPGIGAANEEIVPGEWIRYTRRRHISQDGAVDLPDVIRASEADIHLVPRI